jgi:shikimate dehydrogenase
MAPKFLNRDVEDSDTSRYTPNTIVMDVDLVSSARKVKRKDTNGLTNGHNHDDTPRHDATPPHTATSSKIRVGLVGSSIQASLTPSMHMHEALHYSIPYQYDLLDLDLLPKQDLYSLLTDLEKTYTGLNITYPCKQAIIPYLHHLSPEAKSIGAVNTVVFKHGERYGYNTDVYGFGESFKSELKGVKKRKVLQLGAGGAGSAVSHALLYNGVEELMIVDPDETKGRALQKRLISQFESKITLINDVKSIIEVVDGIVNCTPVGMDKLPGTPIDVTLIRGDMWIADVIYFPLETELMRYARAKGCRVMGGGGMAVGQAVKAFELFSGKKADAVRMREDFERMCEGGLR